ncbi:10650_t:CDS:2 [Paraglomus brasilianum]|uniref:10650_t:CDS:1 n=1 Tax=Paraglomus brasilianum TaxID=144538 RepID=A0A9N9A0N3_9GLOM|nr:10650_t:CDS:2 [Paraglomus brasilianum]
MNVSQLLNDDKTHDELIELELGETDATCWEQTLQTLQPLLATLNPTNSNSDCWTNLITQLERLNTENEQKTFLLQSICNCIEEVRNRILTRWSDLDWKNRNQHLLMLGHICNLLTDPPEHLTTIYRNLYKTFERESAQLLCGPLAGMKNNFLKNNFQRLDIEKLYVEIKPRNMEIASVRKIYTAAQRALMVANIMTYDRNLTIPELDAIPSSVIQEIIKKKQVDSLR